MTRSISLIICCLCNSKRGHRITKWNESSTSARVQHLHIRCNRGTIGRACLPVSTSSSLVPHLSFVFTLRPWHIDQERRCFKYRGISFTVECSSAYSSSFDSFALATCSFSYSCAAIASLHCFFHRPLPICGVGSVKLYLFSITPMVVVTQFSLAPRSRRGSILTQSYTCLVSRCDSILIIRCRNRRLALSLCPCWLVTASSACIARIEVLLWHPRIRLCICATALSSALHWVFAVFQISAA